MLRASPRRGLRRGFSLLELMIVIGIIVVLAALVLAVGTGLLSQSDARETRTSLELLQAAIDEWETSTGRSFTYGTDGQPVASARYDFQQSTADGLFIEQILGENFLGGAEGSRTILARIDGNLLRIRPGSNPPRTQLVDTWGNPIVVVFPGRRWVGPADNALPKDEDGTIRTAQENRLGACRNRRILLVSAGPDGLLGDLTASVGSAARKQAEDNLYSYEPVKP
ncbi:MAG TPA: prepilin-type N-terminal cleavage/methylation domain-containing protein [Phycisphaerales bacterium]|nr:prepilin-type N-terminal cleavage/methylation domain-containing protein [Phycisphaerales bacterium]